MANYKKFLYISGTTEGKKLADLLSEITSVSGKYYKTIVFAAETNEIYNRGQVYGLSKADAKRITDLETAQEALAKAQLAVAEGDKVLTIVDGEGENVGTKTIGATLSIDYGKKAEGDTKYIFLKGKNGQVISEIDATEFIKDKVVTDAELIDEAEEGITIDVPYIKLSFSESVDPIRFSVKDLVDIYDAANIKLTSAFEVPDEYTVDNIASGANMDTVVGELVAGIAEARANAGVTDIDGNAGSISLKSDNTDNGTINLAIGEDGVLVATIIGIKSAAFEEASAFATAEQGETADSAVQEIVVGTQTLDKENNELDTDTLITDLGLDDVAKTGDTLSAESESTNNVKVVLGGTIEEPTLSITETNATFDAENGLSTKGLVTSSVMKAYVEDELSWEEF